MKKQKVNLGNGYFFLKPSPKLIGVKLRPNAKSLPEALTERRMVARWMGGFRIYKVANSFKKLDALLDQVRRHRNVLIGTHIWFAEGSSKPLVPTGSIFVIFADKVKKKDQEALIKKHHLAIEKYLKRGKYILSVTKKSDNPIKASVELEAEPNIIHAEPDMDSSVNFFDVATPSDDLFPSQWQLRNQGATGSDPRSKIIPGSDMKVSAAWKRLGHRGSPNIRVAIVDNGLDMHHPDYVNKIESPFSLFNLERIPTQGPAAGSVHGTSCAGLAVAESNGRGIVGVAPNARFLPIEGASLSWQSLEDVFRHCVRSKADIISCSWGSIEVVDRLTPRHIEVIANVARTGRNGKGCVVLFAVGNENQEFVSHYAAHPDVIAVAGSTSSDEHFSLSNRGREISVCAPAGDWPLIASRASWDDGLGSFDGAFRFWRDGIPRGTPNLYKHFEGTSASCPLVAGVCALVLSANPNLTAAEVKEVLEQTSDRIGNRNEYINGHSLRFGHGRVNADKAVAEALRRLNPTVTIPNSAVASGSGLFRFDVGPQPSEGFGVQVGV
ncbi:MAG: S8 family serine peptidase, partial [Bacteroidota bacterium]